MALDEDNDESDISVSSTEMAEKPTAMTKEGITVKNFPVGTNIFFSSPQSLGFNSAMVEILHSAEDI